MSEQTKDAATVLEEAADLLLIRGVCRDGTWGVPGGSRCVMGAIGEVLPAHGQSIACRALFNHLKTVGGMSNLAQWNDSTTDDFEVIDTLRHVAKDLRNGSPEVTNGDTGVDDAS